MEKRWRELGHKVVSHSSEAITETVVLTARYSERKGSSDDLEGKASHAFFVKTIEQRQHGQCFDDRGREAVAGYDASFLQGEKAGGWR